MKYTYALLALLACSPGLFAMDREEDTPPLPDLATEFFNKPDRSVTKLAHIMEHFNAKTLTIDTILHFENRFDWNADVSEESVLKFLNNDYEVIDAEFSRLRDATHAIPLNQLENACAALLLQRYGNEGDKAFATAYHQKAVTLCQYYVPGFVDLAVSKLNVPFLGTDGLKVIENGKRALEIWRLFETYGTTIYALEGLHKDAQKLISPCLLHLKDAQKLIAGRPSLHCFAEEVEDRWEGNDERSDDEAAVRTFDDIMELFNTKMLTIDTVLDFEEHYDFDAESNKSAITNFQRRYELIHAEQKRLLNATKIIPFSEFENACAALLLLRDSGNHDTDKKVDHRKAVELCENYATSFVELALVTDEQAILKNGEQTLAIWDLFKTYDGTEHELVIVTEDTRRIIAERLKALRGGDSSSSDESSDSEEGDRLDESGTHQAKSWWAPLFTKKRAFFIGAAALLTVAVGIFGYSLIQANKNKKTPARA